MTNENEIINTKLKIKMSEVEGMTLRIPTTFSAYAFTKFYDQMVLIGRTMPSSPLATINETPERLKMAYWGDEQQCRDFLSTWEKGGRDEAIQWIKDNRGWDLSPVELSRLSGLAAQFRTKLTPEAVKTGQVGHGKRK